MHKKMPTKMYAYSLRFYTIVYLLLLKLISNIYKSLTSVPFQTVDASLCFKIKTSFLLSK